MPAPTWPQPLLVPGAHLISASATTPPWCTVAVWQDGKRTAPDPTSTQHDTQEPRDGHA